MLWYKGQQVETKVSSEGVSLGRGGGSDPGSYLLFCQIPVSSLYYLYKSNSQLFVISCVQLDFMFGFHSTIIGLSRVTLAKNRQYRVTLRAQ